MKEQIPQSAPLSRTLQGKTREAKTASVSNVLQAYKNSISQRQEVDEDELLQGKFETAQREELDEDELLQGKFETAQRKESPNNTGLPDSLKAGVEQLSGLDMSDVKVHYNSSKPVSVQAYAYTQGTDIHVAPGQEKHLPHEAWHVVQQKQGRVQPTMQLQGVNINDNEGLEKEANEIGGKAEKGKFEDDEMFNEKNKPVQMIMRNVTQRNIAIARNLRQQAQNLPLNGRHPTNPDTAATSETLYALTPDPGANFRHINAANHFPGKNLAGAVPGAFMIGNHAEQKLIFHGGVNVRNIGVDRNTCQACVNAICANAGQIQHVSEPGGTFLVTPQAMNWVGV